MMDMVPFSPYILLWKCLQLGCDAGDQKQPGSCLQGEVQASAPALLSSLQVSSPISLGVMYVKL